MLGITGGASAGGSAAVGAAVDVFVFKNTVTARVGENNTVIAGALNIHADSDRRIGTYVLMVSAGGTAAINGSIAVVIIGDAADTTEADSYSAESVQQSQTDISASAENSKIVAEYDNAYITQANNTLSQAMANTSMDRYFGAGESAKLEDKTSATIGSGSLVITNEGNVVVEAEESTRPYSDDAHNAKDSDGNVTITEDVYDSFTTVAGGLSASGTAAIGISVNVTVVNSTVEAYIAAQELTSAGDVTVEAESQQRIVSAVLSGQASGTVAVGGAVSVLVFSADVNSYIADSAQITAAGDVTVEAANASSIETITGLSVVKVDVVVAGVGTKASEEESIDD
jgi:hypothetical protein